MDEFNKLKQLISDLEPDAVKFFESSNSSAGTRLRVGMQSLKTQEVRLAVADKKKK